MIKNSRVRAVLSYVLMLALAVTFVFEVRIGFNLLSNRINTETTTLATLSKSAGSARVSIDNPTVYDPTDQPDADGDVIMLKGYNIKVKVDGMLTDDTKAAYGTYTYSKTDSNEVRTLTVKSYKDNLPALVSATSDYFYKTPYALYDAAGFKYSESTLNFYQQDDREGTIPFIHDGSDMSYRAFVACDDDYVVITAKDPFILSHDKVSVHYDDPSEKVMRDHTYSDYEELAANNTIAKMIDKASGSEEVDFTNPYEGGGIIGTSDTYTSTADSKVREQLASYANYTWNKDGTASGTTLKISTTSNEAKTSEWKLTDTVYSYDVAGLQITNLKGSRSSSVMEVTGNVVNTLNTERPYVLVVKYINKANELLGIQVFDKREQPLSAQSYQTFTSTVYSTNVDIADVTAIQFEVY